MLDIVGVVAAIVVIVLLTQKGVKLYLAILAGIVILVLTNNFSLKAIIEITVKSLTSSTMIMLALIMVTLTAFGNLLKETGTLNRIMHSLSVLIRDLRYQVVLLPALIGLITFPGGAVFSAPLVEKPGKALQLSGQRLALANIMFRHIQYLIYPFYPALILFSELSNISIYAFIHFNLVIFFIFYGFVFKYIFRGVKKSKVAENSSPKSTLAKDLRALLYSLSPLIVLLVSAVGLGLYYPVAILAGIAVAFLIYFPRDRAVGETVKARMTMIIKGINWSMSFAIVAILIFKDFLEHSEVVADIMGLLLEKGLPLFLLVMLIPYITGLLSGSSYAAIGIGVPLFMPILPETQAGVYYMALVFIGCLAGYFASPLHMCTILTAEYLKTPLGTVVKELNLMGAAVMLLGAAVLSLFLTFYPAL
ncbi:MAG: DUF401 family protein [Bacillota bacterium]